MIKATRKLYSNFKKFNYKDPMNFTSLLESEEIEVMNTARDFFQETLQPSITEKFRKHEFDKNIYKKIGEMGFLGCTLKEYDGPGVSQVSYGLINREIERVDSSYRSALSVQSSLVIHPIYTFGNKYLKDKYLPGLMSGDIIGCFGLTEPNVGSDPNNMSTKAIKQSDGSYILNGSKNWITNSPIADIFVVWAKDENQKLKGFVLDKHEMEGIEAPSIDGKMSLQISSTGMIMMNDVKVPKNQVLEVEGFKGPFSCLNNARYGISWGVLGSAEFCFHYALDYAQDRNQFDCKLSGYQLTQMKFADMATEISLGLLGCVQLGRLKQNDQLAVEMISMMKRNNCQNALKIARTSRQILGGNGIVDEYHIMRHMTNLEAVNTYEGTNEIHALILGRAITGIQAFSRKL